MDDPRPPVGLIARVAKQAWFELRAKAAVRQAISSAAERLATRHGATLRESEEFRTALERVLKRDTERPVTLRGRVRSIYRGGPAALFEGVEGRLWRSRLRELARRTLRRAREFASGPSWLDKVDSNTFAEQFPREVIAQLESVKDDRGGVALKIVAQEARVREEIAQNRRSRGTLVRFMPSFGAAILGGAAGHFIDLAQPAVVDWLETSLGAAAAAALAVRVSAARSGDPPDDVEAARIVDTHRAISASMRLVVNAVLRVLDSAVVVAPRSEPASLVTALVTVVSGHRQLVAEKESSLRLSYDRLLDLRSELADLLVQAESVAVWELDETLYELLLDAREVIDRLTADDTDRTFDPYSYERQLEDGHLVAQLLRHLIDATARIDNPYGAHDLELPLRPVEIDRSAA